MARFGFLTVGAASTVVVVGLITRIMGSWTGPRAARGWRTSRASP